MSNIIDDAISRYLKQTPTVVSKATGTGELAPLGKSPFDLNSYKYPLEGLGDNDVPHYMMFNINLPTPSKYFGENGTGPSSDTTEISASTADFKYLNGLKGEGGAPLVSNNPIAGNENQAAAVESFKGAITGRSIGGALTGAIRGGIRGKLGAVAVGNKLSIQPQLKRIDTSIALYMPDTSLVAEYDHDWGAVSMTEAMGDLGIAAAFSGQVRNVTDVSSFKAVVQDVKNLWNEGVGFFTGSSYHGHGAGQDAELAGIAAQLSETTGPGIKELLFRSSNRAINPQVQMVFTRTANREFLFDYDFQPRSQKEAVEIYHIIRTFKRFAAPEIANEGSGRYFIPPAQFDIRFFFKGKENPYIASISTCALTKVSVNYNQTPPFASFNDGMPVHIHLQLRFREMDIITRELIEKFGY